MYDVRCTMYDVRCTMYDVRCTMYDVRCTMYEGLRTRGAAELDFKKTVKSLFSQTENQLFIPGPKRSV